MSGIVRSIGWETDEETKKEVFRAVVEYPGGPSDMTRDMTPAVVWDRYPVEIVVLQRDVVAPRG